MKYKKSELTKIAKYLATVHEKFLEIMCISEETTKSEFGEMFRNGIDNELLIELSKRYAKYVKNESYIDLDNGDVQTCQDIINEIVSCCEENNWFENDG